METEVLLEKLSDLTTLTCKNLDILDSISNEFESEGKISDKHIELLIDIYERNIERR